MSDATEIIYDVFHEYEAALKEAEKQCDGKDVYYLHISILAQLQLLRALRGDILDSVRYADELGEEDDE